MTTKKGFTLTELIAGMIISAVIAIAAGNIYSLNAQLIKKHSFETHRSLELQGAVKHIAINIQTSAWAEIPDKNKAILYSHSDEKIHRYSYENNAVKYSEGNKPPITLISNVASVEMFKGIGEPKTGKRYRGAVIDLREKTDDINAYQTSSAPFLRRSVYCKENWDIMYYNTGTVKILQYGTKNCPYKSYVQGAHSSPKEKVLFYGKNNVMVGTYGSAYVTKGASVSVHSNNAVVLSDFHAIGAANDKVAIGQYSDRFPRISCSANNADHIIMDNVEYTARKGIYIGKANLTANMKSGVYIANSTFKNIMYGLTISNISGVYISNCVFKDITSTAVTCDVSENIYIHHNDFMLSSAPLSGNDGYGIVLNDHARIGMNRTMSNNTFVNMLIGMIVSEPGSYHYSSPLTDTIRDNKFSDCRMAISLGGYQPIGSQYSLTISNNSITGNVVSSKALYLRICTPLPSNSVFSICNNTVSGLGLGIILERTFPGPSGVLGSPCPIPLIANNQLLNTGIGISCIGGCDVVNNIIGSCSGAGLTWSSTRRSGKVTNNIVYNTSPVIVQDCPDISNNTLYNTDGLFTNSPGVMSINNSIFAGSSVIKDSSSGYLVTDSVIEAANPNPSKPYKIGAGVVSAAPDFRSTTDGKFILNDTWIYKNNGQGGAELGAYGGPGAAGWDKGVGCQR